jgi:uncharacterized protein (TIGR02271 family)
MAGDLTTLVCLFHHQDQAQAALHDLTGAGIPQSSISLINASGSTPGQYAGSSLEELGVPDRDRRHLMDGVRDGGVIVAIAAISDHVSKVEEIFGRHKATKIDEAVTHERETPVVPPVAAPVSAQAGETVIPIVEEELAVGKRTVDQGGVRVYRRVVEIPVEQSVNLREEHVTVDRHPVDRAVTQQDIAMGAERTIELTETAEEAVVGKSARVVEEVRVGKEATEHAEQIHDTVRRTEVEVEEITPGSDRTTTGRKL